MSTELQTVTPAPLATTQPSVEQLIQHALEHQTPAETMERLLAMAERVNAHRAEEAYNAALAAFQADCPVILKTHKGHQSNYAKLEDIVAQTQELRQKHGLHYSFDTEHGDKLLTVVCRVTHSAGHTAVSRASFPVEASGGMSAQQKVASAITYAKRYALMNALGIVVADEDNDAAFPTPNPKPDADPNAPAAQTRTERQEAATMKDRATALYKTWKGRNPNGDKAAFNAWCQNVLTSGGDYLKLETWNEQDMSICEKAVSHE